MSDDVPSVPRLLSHPTSSLFLLRWKDQSGRAVDYAFFNSERAVDEIMRSWLDPTIVSHFKILFVGLAKDRPSDLLPPSDLKTHEEKPDAWIVVVGNPRVCYANRTDHPLVLDLPVLFFQETTRPEKVPFSATTWQQLRESFRHHVRAARITRYTNLA